MLAEGLPGGYADALVTGLWPSLDVLPEAEKSRTGRALDETCHAIGAVGVAAAG